MVLAVIVSGKQAEKVCLSSFFCVAPSPVLEHRRRFEQLIVAQVLDALRFSAQRNTPASLFAPLDLASNNADLSTADANVQLPTAASLDRTGNLGATDSSLASAASSATAALGASSGAAAVGLSSGAGSTASGWVHAESGAFVLDLSLCDASERSWLAEVAQERRRSDAAANDDNVVDDADADDDGDDREPRFYVFWRAVHASCFTLVCDEVDNRQLAARWLDVMARMVTEHFRNPLVLQTPDVLLSQPGELHHLLNQLLPCGQLLFNTEIFHNGD